jgi:hypothetical protein
LYPTVTEPEYAHYESERRGSQQGPDQARVYRPENEVDLNSIRVLKDEDH